MDNFSKMVEGVKITIEKMKKTPAELPWYMSVEQLEMTGAHWLLPGWIAG